MAKIGRNNKKGAIEKPKNTFATIVRIFSYMADFKFMLSLVFIFIALTSLARVAGTAFLKNLIDKYITPLSKNYSVELFNNFIQFLIILALIYLVGVISSYIYSRIMLTISTRTLLKIRVNLFNKMEKLPIRYFDKHIHGDIMSLYTNDIDAIREMLSENISSLVLSSISIICTFSMMLYYSWQLTIIIAIMVTIMINRAKKISKESHKYFSQQQQQLGKINGYIEEMIEGQKVVKAFCYEEKSKLNFEVLNDFLCEISTNANSYANILMPIMINISNINYAIVSIAGTILVFSSILSLGTVIAFLQYTRSFVHPIAEISQQFNSVLTALAGAERIFNAIDEKQEIDDGKIELVNVRFINKELVEVKENTNLFAWKIEDEEGNFKYSKLNGRIQFNNVIFGYDSNKTIINKINLIAYAGEKVALVGSTGAGKTTITNLINRFYDVQSGEITFDGINIKDIKKQSLRNLISMVLQDTNLFTESIMENIRYGKLDATDQEVKEAAKLANADYFISHLPEGYNTILTSNGENLSQGEKQLISIARAIVADPQILILDEATSSVDTRTEKLIESGMNELMRGKTVFIIAHRLSTVKNADSIAVLENGLIIEQGNHSELLNKKGRYYQLYNGIAELN